MKRFVTFIQRRLYSMLCNHQWENIIRGELKVTYVERKCLKCGKRKAKGV